MKKFEHLEEVKFWIDNKYNPEVKNFLEFLNHFPEKILHILRVYLSTPHELPEIIKSFRVVDFEYDENVLEIVINGRDWTSSYYLSEELLISPKSYFTKLKNTCLHKLPTLIQNNIDTYQRTIKEAENNINILKEYKKYYERI